MCIKNLCRSIILIGLTFTLLLGIFTDNVIAASEPNLSGSDIQQLNAQLGENEITQSISKDLPSLQLGDDASDGAQDAVLLLQKLLAGLNKLDKDLVNGTFSDQTKEALKDYQKSNDITDDGTVDKNTWSKLGDDVLSRINALSSQISLDRHRISGPSFSSCPPCP